MIKFFRRIRQRLLSQNRFSKYLVYAIGEIALVMIGILLALQVNNWNQSRVQSQQEKVLLEEIHEEFKYNKSELEFILENYRNTRDNTYKVTKYFPIDVEKTNLDSIAHYLKNTHFQGDFDYANIALEKLGRASSYDLISDIELRNLLYRFNIVLDDYVKQEDIVISYLKNRYERVMGEHIPRPYRKGIKDPRTDLAFLEGIKFESLVIQHRKNINNMLNRVEENGILEIIDKIINLSKPNL